MRSSMLLSPAGVIFLSLIAIRGVLVPARFQGRAAWQSSFSVAKFAFAGMGSGCGLVVELGFVSETKLSFQYNFDQFCK